MPCKKCDQDKLTNNIDKMINERLNSLQNEQFEEKINHMIDLRLDHHNIDNYIEQIRLRIIAIGICIFLIISALILAASQINWTL